MYIFAIKISWLLHFFSWLPPLWCRADRSRYCSTHKPCTWHWARCLVQYSMKRNARFVSDAIILYGLWLDALCRWDTSVYLEPSWSVCHECTYTYTHVHSTVAIASSPGPSLPAFGGAWRWGYCCMCSLSASAPPLTLATAACTMASTRDCCPVLHSTWPCPL